MSCLRFTDRIFHINGIMSIFTFVLKAVHDLKWLLHFKELCVLKRITKMCKLTP